MSNTDWHLWQERAPQGPWFLHTPDGSDIFFGGDTESAEQCLAAINRVNAGIVTALDTPGYSDAERIALAKAIAGGQAA
jgi:hypothetical protein